MGKSKSISGEILKFFIKLNPADNVLLDFTYHPYEYFYKSFIEDLRVNKATLRSSLNRLRNRDLIKEEVNEVGEVILKLTDKGQKEALLKALQAGKTKELDNNFVLVIFDIPENFRVVRNILRRRLQEFGFRALQKSVWVSELDVFEAVNKYFSDSGLDKYVLVIESRRINRS